MEPLRAYLASYTYVSNEDWNIIAQNFEQRMIKKGSILVKEGGFCRHLFFLERGLMRYYITRDGREITKFFTDAPYCFTSQVSFSNQLPATENIDAIEDCVVWQIPLLQATDLLQLPSWNTFVRKLIQQVQFYTESILQELQTETAENRYRKFLLTKPELVQRIPLKYLASYFGIAPQSLSRIRKKLLTSRKS